MNINTKLLYEIISDMIQSLEAQRDYADGLSPDEEAKLKGLNEMWDTVRGFHDFEEPGEAFTSIRDAISNELEIRNMSVADFARKTEIRYATLTEFLNGNKGLSTDHLDTCLRELKLLITSKNFI